MTFRSRRAHGFARVAACTAGAWIADPPRSAGDVAAAGGPGATIGMDIRPGTFVPVPPSSGPASGGGHG